MKENFNKLSTSLFNWLSDILGSPGMFLIAILFVITWILSGPFFDFSDTWELIINTSTAIITFLTVFIIQNTQNRNDRATQLKLDELIHSNKNARNDFIDLEDLSEKKLKELRKEYNEYKSVSKDGGGKNKE
ncbi:MAG: low affinity iron permease family protein [Candidatus Levybacteria bacterium]|nr:low affinity iron permease family protein [Candidatus Levybacteria bacterium]